MFSVPLFEEYRADMLECIHFGMVAVVSPAGLVHALGDPEWPCYYRSCSKPIQALPVILRKLDRKYGLTEEETAMFSASHFGDAYHVRLLESILEKTGLQEAQMIMQPTYPNREGEKERLLRAGEPPRKLYHNCSGKHLGMMLLARELGEPVSDYWIRGSRTQEEILSVISQMTDVPPDSIHIGVDGCGVPVYAVPFRAIASSYLRLQQPELIRDDRLAEAVARNVSMIHCYPNTIAGEHVICSVLAKDPDLLGKSGAQGVYALGIRSLHLGVVLKILDGSQEEFTSAVLHICHELGCQSPVLDELSAQQPDVIVNDNRETVGSRKAIFSLR